MLQGASGGKGEYTYRESRVANSRREGTLQPGAVMAVLRRSMGAIPLINRGGTTLEILASSGFFQRALFVLYNAAPQIHRTCPILLVRENKQTQITKICLKNILGRSKVFAKKEGEFL